MSIQNVLTRAVIKRMKEKRKTLSISLRDLQKITGISFSILSRYERGAVVPSELSYKKLFAWVTGKPIPSAPPNLNDRIAKLEQKVAGLEKKRK